MRRVTKILKYIALIFIILFILLLIAWRLDRTFFHPYQPERGDQIFSDVQTLKFTVPKDEEGCLAKGGIWGKLGPHPGEECNLYTTDSDKTCSGSNECEGVCLADLTSDQLREGMAGKLFHMQGKCSKVIKLVGCRGYVYKGWASVVCAD